MMRQYELVERVQAYNPHTDEALLNKAYVYAMQKHGSQKRASGDPYFNHPLEVAAILTELKLDDASIAVALLHDTIEDTDATRAEIDQLFGPEIGAIVDGLTKIERLQLVTREEAQAENLRKLLLAISADVRVLLVKLADRLHNMRTLEFMAPEKQRRIANETMEIYAPLAGRMGMQDMRDELEDLSFRYMNPEAYETVTNRLAELSTRNEGLITKIEDELRELLVANGLLNTSVKGRQKKPYSVFRKMQSKSLSFEQLSDVYGFRILVDDIPGCYRALGIVHTRWRVVPGRFKDYISTPKQNDYRSLHTTVVGPHRQRVELLGQADRVRTLDRLDQRQVRGIRPFAAHDGAHNRLRQRDQLEQLLERGAGDAVEHRERAGDEQLVAHLRALIHAAHVFKEHAAPDRCVHQREGIGVLACRGQQQRQPAHHLLVAQHHHRMLEARDLHRQPEGGAVDQPQQLERQRRVALQGGVDLRQLGVVAHQPQQFEHHRLARLQRADGAVLRIVQRPADAGGGAALVGGVDIGHRLHAGDDERHLAMRLHSGRDEDRLAVGGDASILVDVDECGLEARQQRRRQRRVRAAAQGEALAVAEQSLRHRLHLGVTQADGRHLEHSIARRGPDLGRVVQHRIQRCHQQRRAGFRPDGVQRAQHLADRHPILRAHRQQRQARADRLALLVDQRCVADRQPVENLLDTGVDAFGCVHGHDGD